MDSDNVKLPGQADAMPRTGVLVGRAVTIRASESQPSYFTEVHRSWIGKTGRVHAIVPALPRDNPLVKVGFDEGTEIVFYRLSELEIHEDGAPQSPSRHGQRGSHLPE